MEAANADTLKLELKKILTKILPCGGGEIKDRGETTDGSSGVLKAIDEAIRILNCLREAGSKMLDSDIPSSSSPSPKAEVPKEFKCTLSNAIMVEPVVIASGQTYEKRYITEWLKHERTCPKSDAILDHSLWSPNHLVDELITQWCRANKYDRLKPSDEIVTALSADGIDSLLQRISSPSSVSDQTEAAKELRFQTKKFPNVRASVVFKIPGSITRLLSPFSASGGAVDSNPELQEDIITAFFNISIVSKNKTVIAENRFAIPLITKSLRHGTLETRRTSAATLLSLLAVDSNKRIIGNSKVLDVLTFVIHDGDMIASLEAASVIGNLCLVLENRKKAISVGVVNVLTRKIEAGINVVEFLYVLVLLSAHKDAIEEIEKALGFIKCLFSILRKRRCSVSCEYALMIFFNMCNMATPHSNKVRTRMTIVDEEENKYGTFTKLTKQGSDGVVKNAKAILHLLKLFGTGKDPQMDSPPTE